MGMEQSVIERASRALCLASFEGHDPDAICFNASENPCPSVALDEAETVEETDGEHVIQIRYWRLYAPQVRAVLTAIRDPSESMVRGSWEDVGESPELSMDVWQAMIDTMLPDSPSERKR